ncbi:hypothetical protein FPV67DRAFT_1453087 [Lyophyllum atratum]|nr:hypothetical protein FPV67DRAFT_1453087 [Lyophyllum atratum]
MYNPRLTSHHSQQAASQAPPPSSSSTGPAPLPALQDSTTVVTSDVGSDAAVFASVEQQIQALNRASNLRDVIAQVESGAVAWMRDLYGPQEGHSAHPLWKRMKVTINRREKVFSQLMDPLEFAGNKERFFAFFASACSKLPAPKKQKARNNQNEAETMLPYRLVVEAVVQAISE